MYFNVNQREVDISDIPGVVIEPEGEAKDILLIYYHGWGSSVESSLFRASIWAAAGYSVLLPEEALHGVRGSWDYDGDMEKLPAVLLQNLDEFDEVIRYAEGHYPNRKRIVVGHSLGGFTAMGLLAREDIDGAIALNGMGDWQAMMRPPYEARIRKLNPIDHVAAHLDKAILMLNGEVDQSVDPEYQKNYYERLVALNEHAAPRHFEIMEMTGHVVTTTMMEITLAFLKALEKPSSVL